MIPADAGGMLTTLTVTQMVENGVDMLEDKAVKEGAGGRARRQSGAMAPEKVKEVAETQKGKLGKVDLVKATAALFKRRRPESDVKEVWFAGAHSDMCVQIY